MEHMANVHSMKYYGHSLLDHMSFKSPKRTLCLNPMKYHGAFIENTYCH